MGECNILTVPKYLRRSGRIIPEETSISMETIEETIPWEGNNFFSREERIPKLMADLHTTFSSINVKKEILLKEENGKYLNCSIEDNRFNKKPNLSKHNLNKFNSEIQKGDQMAESKILVPAIPKRPSRSTIESKFKVDQSPYLGKDYRTDMRAINKSSKLVRLKVRGKYPCMAGSFIDCQILLL